MPLAELLDKMKGDMPSKKKDRSVNEMVDETLPSDESLQSAKAGRRQTANEVTDYLAQKGWPTAGALAGTAVDLSADMIPEDRESYKEQMVSSMSPVGSVGKVGKLAAKEAVPTLSSIPQAIRQKLMASGDELAAFNASPREYMEKLTQTARESRDAAQKALDLKKGIGISKGAKPAEEALQFEGMQSKETRRLMDSSKKFDGLKKVADIESGSKALPKASEILPEERVVRDVKFPETERPSVQQLKKIREAESMSREREAALKRLRE